MRPKECPYCETNFSVEKFEEHVDYCGSKTKKCEACGANVITRERIKHITGGQCENNVRINEAKVGEELKRFQEQ